MSEQKYHLVNKSKFDKIFKDIAGKIREKLNVQTTYKDEELANAIETIIPLNSQGSITVSSTGAIQIVEPDGDYNAFSEIIVEPIDVNNLNQASINLSIGLSQNDTDTTQFLQARANITPGYLSQEQEIISTITENIVVEEDIKFFPDSTDREYANPIYFPNGFTLKADANARPENIKIGETINGVIGTYEGNLQPQFTYTFSNDKNNKNYPKQANGIKISPDEQFTGLEAVTISSLDDEWAYTKVEGEEIPSSMDILSGKTAFVNGQKINGELVFQDSKNYSSLNFDSNNGFTKTINAGDYLKPNTQLTLNFNSEQFGDATANQVLKGKTFTSQDGIKQEGAIDHKIGETEIIYDVLEPDKIYGTNTYYENGFTIPGGTNLKEENIKHEIEIFGVKGNFTSYGNDGATSADILQGKLAGVDGKDIEGAVPTYSLSNNNNNYLKIIDNNIIATPNINNITLETEKNYLINNIIVEGDSNLTAENIREGRSIFGIHGNFTGGLKINNEDRTINLFDGSWDYSKEMNVEPTGNYPGMSIVTIAPFPETFIDTAAGTIFGESVNENGLISYKSNLLPENKIAFSNGIKYIGSAPEIKKENIVKDSSSGTITIPAGYIYESFDYEVEQNGSNNSSDDFSALTYSNSAKPSEIIKGKKAVIRDESDNLTIIDGTGPEYLNRKAQIKIKGIFDEDSRKLNIYISEGSLNGYFDINNFYDENKNPIPIYTENNFSQGDYISTSQLFSENGQYDLNNKIMELTVTKNDTYVARETYFDTIGTTANAFSKVIVEVLGGGEGSSASITENYIYQISQKDLIANNINSNDLLSLEIKSSDYDAMKQATVQIPLATYTIEQGEENDRNIPVSLDVSSSGLVFSSSETEAVPSINVTIPSKYWDSTIDKLDAAAQIAAENNVQYGYYFLTEDGWAMGLGTIGEGGSDSIPAWNSNNISIGALSFDSYNSSISLPISATEKMYIDGTEQILSILALNFGNATLNDVKSGATFTSVSGLAVEGTMPAAEVSLSFSDEGQNRQVVASVKTAGYVDENTVIEPKDVPTDATSTPVSFDCDFSVSEVNGSQERTITLIAKAGSFENEYESIILSDNDLNKLGLVKIEELTTVITNQKSTISDIESILGEPTLSEVQ